MNVTLTDEELKAAARVGVERCIYNAANGKQPRYGGPGGHAGWNASILGAIGELAVARALNITYRGLENLGKFDAADVGRHIEVRTVDNPSKRLIIHKEDKKHAPYVLVAHVSRLTHYRILGWTVAGDVMHDRYWTDPGTGRPAYFIPTRDLRPIADLPNFLDTLKQAHRAMAS